MMKASSIMDIWSILIFALAFVFKVNADVQACDSGSGVCVAFSIPVSTSGTADSILASVEGPSDLGWVGFGFGTQMTDSLIFVMWENNFELVASVRYATGHQQPEVYSGPTITTISSNFTSSAFNAQVRLDNATTWQNSGSLDISSSSAGVIWAIGSSAPSDPSDPGSDFQQHQNMGTFSIDMKSAQTADTTTSGSGSEASGTVTLGSGIVGATATPGSTSGSSGSGTNSGSAAPAITGGFTEPSTSTGLSKRDQIIIAHGVLMGLAFVILFPLGAIIIRFLSAWLPVPTKLHWMNQIFAFVIVLVAMGLGIYLSEGESFYYFHQVFGVVIVCLLFLQAGLGTYHHHRFVIDKPSSRRWFTHAHLWLGRSTIIFGLVNCGFGLRLAYVDWKYCVIWWIVCGVLVLAYIVVYFFTGLLAKRKGARRAGEPFGNANGPGFSPQRYATAESYTSGGGQVGGSPQSYELKNRV